MSSSRLRKLLLPLLRAVKEGRPITFKMRSCAQQGLYLIQKPISLKKTAAKVRQRIEKQSSRASHNQETAAIREAVRYRAAGRCEGCQKRWGFWLWTMDHFDGGTGKSQRQSIENCWVLCGAPSIPGSCHFNRQRNLPSVGIWNNRFAAHAAKYGYPVITHIEHAEPAKAGGAP